MDVQAADAGRPPGLTGSVGWATAGPSAPVGPLCPWCTAPLLDAAAERCGACGAQLTGAPDAPILGVTAVAPSTARSSRNSAAPRRRSVIAWITGDEDLVAAARMPPSEPPPTDGRTDLPAAMPALDAAALGPPSADALAPPDARLQLEMLRIELEGLGLAPGPAAPGDATEGASPPTADGRPAPDAPDATDIRPAPDAPDAPDAAGGRPAPDAPDAT